MTKNEMPNYVGRQFWNKFSKIGRNFKMFIESKRRLDDKFEEIKGAIIDNSGEFSFDGKISRDEINFSVKTSSILLGSDGTDGYLELIRYNGRRKEEYYEGEFRFSYTLSEGSLREVKGSFVLRPYFHPRMN